MDAVAARAAEPGPAVCMEGICKSFGRLRALNDVSLSLAPGEIRALVGENGAGKTTLMNVLYGMYRPDAGRIQVWGREVGRDWSPRQAISWGIGMLHQHFSLIPNHTVLENIVMPKLRWKQLFPPWGQHREEIEKLCGRYGFSVDPGSMVGSLSVGQQQQVEILKLLYQGAKVLILDEPTGVLTPQQTDALLRLLVVLRSQGLSVVFITHKLAEAFAVSDTITVLRGGKHVATLARTQTTPEEVARLMVSRPTLEVTSGHRAPAGERVVLEVTDLVVEDERHKTVLDHVSLCVRAGEIVGVAGVAGNGQTELAEALVGIRRVHAGRIRIDGQDATAWSIGRRRRWGLGFIPEDRHLYGMVPEMSVAENLVLDRATSQPFSHGGILHRQVIEHAAREAISTYDVRAPGPDVPIKNLSGGNQQKVVLARALAGGAKVLVVCEPTRGLDFAATEYVRKRLAASAEEGMGVLLISSELEELLSLSHRLLVMYRGRVVGELPRESFDVERIGLLMTGQTRTPAVEPNKGDERGTDGQGTGHFGQSAQGQ
ncbi:MAG: ABC transporter ATP-binding protein [Bacillota bacterium]